MSVMNMTCRYSRFTSLPIAGTPDKEVLEDIIGLEASEWADEGLEDFVSMAEYVIENTDEDVLELDFSKDSDGKVWSFFLTLIRQVDIKSEEEEDVPDLRVVDAPTSAISDLDSDDVPSIRKLEVRVSHASGVISDKMVTMAFRCESCGNKQYKKQAMFMNDTVYPEEECPCGSQSYEPLPDESDTTNYQYMVVEDLAENGDETIQAYLYDDLVRSANPGERVDVIAAIVPHQPDKSENIVERRVVALEVFNRDDKTGLELSDEDVKMCRELAESDNTVERLVASFAPDLVELDAEKRGLLHAMVSFNDEYDTEEDRRGVIHCGLIGNPSTAKSKLLKEADRIAIRSEMSSGDSTSGIGLTAAVVKDEVSENHILKPGILPRANGGIAITDEFDKMTDTDKQKMSQALQHQEISVAKAGINADLATECPLLAASNPKEGTFNEFDPLMDQIDYPPEILSRFDLLYQVESPDDSQKLADALVGKGGSQSMADLTTEELRLYIHWCRQIDVRVPESVKDYSSKIVKEYLDYVNNNNSSSWFDARKGKAIIRLAKSHARLNGRDEVMCSDIDAAVELLKESVGEFFDSSAFDVESLYTGRSSTHNAVRKTVREIVDDGEATKEMLVKKAAVESEVEDEIVRSEVESMIDEDEIWVSGKDEKVRAD